MHGENAGARARQKWFGAGGLPQLAGIDAGFNRRNLVLFTIDARPYEAEVARAEGHGVPAFADARAMLAATRPDVVHVTTLPASLYDTGGREIGRAVLRFDMQRHLRSFLRSSSRRRRQKR